MERPEADGPAAHSLPPPAAVDLQQAEAMWAMETGAGDCDCPGPPPPEFLLPPPPRPPFLQDMYCSEDPLPDLETCDALPVSHAIGFISIIHPAKVSILIHRKI